MLQQTIELIEMINNEIAKNLTKGDMETFENLIKLRSKAYELYTEQLKREEA